MEQRTTTTQIHIGPIGITVVHIIGVGIENTLERYRIVNGTIGDQELQRWLVRITMIFLLIVVGPE